MHASTDPIDRPAVNQGPRGERRASKAATPEPKVIELADLLRRAETGEQRAESQGAELVQTMEGDVAAVTAEGAALTPVERKQADSHVEQAKSAEASLHQELQEARRTLEVAREERAKFSGLSNFFGNARLQRFEAQSKVEDAEAHLAEVQAKISSSGEAGEKVTRLETRRTKLASEERRTKKITRGLGDLFSAKWEKVLATEEFGDVKEQYTESRAEVVGNNLSALLQEQAALTDARAVETKASASKLYKLHKRLGEVNLKTVTGWQPESRVGKLLAETMSARLAVNSLLLGVGIGFGAVGMTEAAITSYVGLRRGFSFAASSAGSYDMLRMRDQRKLEKKLQKDPDKPFADFTEEELWSYKAHMEAMAAVGGVRVSSIEVYKQLQQEVGKRFEKERTPKQTDAAAHRVAQTVESLMNKSDKELDDWLREEEKDDTKRRAIAAAIAATFGGLAASGMTAKAVRGVVGLGEKALGVVGDMLIGAAEAQEGGVPDAAVSVGEAAAGAVEHAEVGAIPQIDLWSEEARQMIDALNADPYRAADDVGFFVQIMGGRSSFDPNVIQLKVGDVTIEYNSESDMIKWSEGSGPSQVFRASSDGDVSDLRSALGMTRAVEAAPSDVPGEVPEPTSAVETPFVFDAANPRGLAEYIISHRAGEGLLTVKEIVAGGQFPMELLGPSDQIGIDRASGELYYNASGMARWDGVAAYNELMKIVSSTQSIPLEDFSTGGGSPGVAEHASAAADSSTGTRAVSEEPAERRSAAPAAEVRALSTQDRIFDSGSTPQERYTAVRQLAFDKHQSAFATNYGGKMVDFRVFEGQSTIRVRVEGGEWQTLGATSSFEEWNQLSSEVAPPAPASMPEVTPSAESVPVGAAIEKGVFTVDDATITITEEGMKAARALGIGYNNGVLHFPGGHEIDMSVSAKTVVVTSDQGIMLDSGAIVARGDENDLVVLVSDGENLRQFRATSAEELYRDMKEHFDALDAVDLSTLETDVRPTRAASGLFVKEAERVATSTNPAHLGPREGFEDFAYGVRWIDDKLDEVFDRPDSAPEPREAMNPEQRAQWRQEVHTEARMAVDAQRAAIEPLGVAPNEDALMMLRTRDLVKVGGGPTFRFERQGNGYRIMFEATESNQHQAVADLLGPEYKEIIAQNEGVPVYQADGAIQIVEQRAAMLTELIAARNYMLDNGLDSTPQYDALTKDIMKIRDAVARYGHVIRDDPEYSGASARQIMEDLFKVRRGKFQAGRKPYIP